MGLFDKMKNFAGGHGVTVALTQLDGEALDSHGMDLEATTLHGSFRVEASKGKAAVLKHSVVLFVQSTAGGGKRKQDVARFDASELYEVAPGSPRDVSFSFSGIDLAAAARSVGAGTHALVIDKRVTLELRVDVDVKGSPVDPSTQHSVPVTEEEAAAAAPSGGGWNWKARIDEMFATLDADASVELHQAQVGAPLSDGELAEVQSKLGFNLDARFVAFFRVANGLKLIWTTKDAEQQATPGKTFIHQSENSIPAGLIDIPPLAEMMKVRQDLGASYLKPYTSISRCLGGWDGYELRSSLRVVDDFLGASDSYHLPAVFLTSRFPDPPMLMLDDYAAADSDRAPMLARDYLALVVTTLGARQPRLDRFHPHNYAGNHPLFVAPETWLQEAPSAKEALEGLKGVAADTPAAQALNTWLKAEGISTAGTPYAIYNEEAPLRRPKGEPLRRVHPVPDWADYLDGYSGVLELPNFAPQYYVVHRPAPNVRELRYLIGRLVKAHGPRMERVGCLVAVDDEGRGTLFSASEGAFGTNGFMLNADTLVGLAEVA